MREPASNSCVIEFIGAGGVVLSRVQDPRAQYLIESRDRYVRVRIRDGQGAFAWTQPVMLANPPVEKVSRLMADRILRSAGREAKNFLAQLSYSAGR